MFHGTLLKVVKLTAVMPHPIAHLATSAISARPIP
jgi:hypothetical protein